MRKDDVIALIEQAFADTVYPGDDKLINGCHCEECAGIAEAFIGKRWLSLTDVKFLRRYESALTLMYPEAFRYYMPAFMRAAVVDPKTADVIPHGLEFNLMPHHSASSEKFIARISGFTPQQKQAIKAYLKFEPYPMHWTIMMRQQQQQAIDFWDTFEG